MSVAICNGQVTTDNLLQTIYKTVCVGLWQKNQNDVCALATDNGPMTTDDLVFCGNGIMVIGEPHL